jgi:hypothetical protein
VDALVEHHDALRMRFEFVDGQWRQDVAPVESADVLRCPAAMSMIRREVARTVWVPNWSSMAETCGVAGR